MSREQALAEAEAFIRRALERAQKGKVTNKAIKAAAMKVVKALPPVKIKKAA